MHGLEIDAPPGIRARLGEQFRRRRGEAGEPRRIAHGRKLLGHHVGGAAGHAIKHVRRDRAPRVGAGIDAGIVLAAQRFDQHALAIAELPLIDDAHPGIAGNGPHAAAEAEQAKVKANTPQ